MVPSSTGNIERMLIEMRPRLQSANFFIAFRRNFADIESTTIDLAKDRLTIAIGKGAARERYEIRVGDFFQLHTQTLSSLVIKNRYLCFRVNTNETNFGTELLSVPGQGGSGNPDEYELLNVLVNVEPNKRYLLLCSNCGGSLTTPEGDGAEGVAFRRVLELPSEQMDANEWFCHRHDHSGEVTEGTSTNQKHEHDELTTKLEPQPDDLLYGLFYALLHRSTLQRVHIRNERFVHCRRCLQFLGTSAPKSRLCVKLWYESVRFQPVTTESRVPMALFRVDEPLELFRLLVRKTVRECNFVTHLGLPPMFKIMFELHRPGLEGDVFYLLLQIMDSGLNVYRINQKQTEHPVSSGSCSEDIDDIGKEGSVPYSKSSPKHFSHGTDDASSDGHEEDDEDDDVFIKTSVPCRKHNIVLERHRAMKLMYWYEKYEQQPLFTFWRDDSNVVNLELSEAMFTAAIRYLDDNSSYVPECYRVNQGFNMSYLDIT